MANPLPEPSHTASAMAIENIIRTDKLWRREADDAVIPAAVQPAVPVQADGIVAIVSQILGDIECADVFLFYLNGRISPGAPPWIKPALAGSGLPVLLHQHSHIHLAIGHCLLNPHLGRGRARPSKSIPAAGGLHQVICLPCRLPGRADLMAHGCGGIGVGYLSPAAGALAYRNGMGGIVAPSRG